ncbi:MAG: sulfatase-like hydrolase/transferase [Streptococcaceae bacterium]|nr:sulfatase-like hydrolase/transferase [Streptococcaceae bacterium]
MISNLSNLKDLSGNFGEYALAIVVVLIFSFLPFRMHLSRKFPYQLILLFAAVGIFSVQNSVAADSTPLAGYLSYIKQNQQISNLNASIVSETSSEQAKIYKAFLRHGIPSAASHSTLRKPNVIIIFTEGLSKSVLSYDGGKLTPNLNQFAKDPHVISFTNYYDQTAATYKGVRGQLYSSQQLDNGYENGADQIKQNFDTKLISIQSILANAGYNTTFINAEPPQKIWTSYVNQLGFQKVVTETSNLITFGSTTFVSDQQNYQLLLKTAQGLSNQNKPFMLADYTFQTHLSVDASLKWGNGNNIDLNHFYNMDNAFGKFIQQFRSSPLSKNTILVFTADHASYPDSLFQSTFGKNQKTFIAQIPLMIYAPDLTNKTIDAGNRNSLALAPTVLDLANETQASNFFLGNSLFGQASPYEKISVLPPFYYNLNQIEDGNPKTIESSSVIDNIEEFYKISLNEKKKDLAVPPADD